MASLRKLFGLRSQKGTPVAHSPYNILYVVRQVGPQPLYTTSSLIFTSALRASVNMAPRSYISAMDLPTVLYILHIPGGIYIPHQCIYTPNSVYILPPEYNPISIQPHTPISIYSPISIYIYFHRYIYTPISIYILPSLYIYSHQYIYTPTSICIPPVIYTYTPTRVYVLVIPLSSVVHN